MTPLQFAQQECANYAHDGSCSGIGIKGDGSIFSFGYKNSCVLTDRKARCRYFEECVLPMRFDDPRASGQARAKQHQEAVDLYSAWTKGRKRSNHPMCPMCQKREIEPPKRFCYVCSETRKKDQDLEAKRRGRRVRKTASGTPVNIGPNEGQKDPSATTIADTPSWNPKSLL